MTLAWVGGVALPARPGLAQALPEAVVTARPVAADHKAAIADFINAHKSALSGPDIAALNRARRMLCDPCFNPGASESFRREYSTQMVPVLDGLVGHAADEVAVNAVRIAGALGTDAGLDLIIKRALKDKRIGVRVMAAKGFGLGMRAAAVGAQPSMTPREAKDALDKFGVIVGAENDPHVLDAMVGALDNCAGLDKAKLDDTGERAVTVLFTLVSRMATNRRAGGGGAGGAMYEGAIGHGAQAVWKVVQTKPVPSVAVAAAGVAGDIVAGIVRRVDAGSLTDADRSRLGLTAALCERIVQLSAQQLGSQALTYGLEPRLLESKDAEFKDAAGRMLKDLSGDPFKHPAARFK